MPTPPRALAALAAIFATAAVSSAAKPLHARIDRLIAAGHAGYETQVAPVSTDAEFLRRVYLDFAGTIPTADETRAFLVDTTPDKRTRLVDRLLAGPAYARRMAQVFDVVLMERRGDGKVPRAAWEEFLRTAFAENRPYDGLVREILSADGVDPKARPAAKFYLDRDFEPNLVTRDIARVFLGRNIQCAQCHDHPLVESYKQADYYGLLAFLNRSFLFPNANAPNAVLAEKADGEVNFVSVFDKAKKQGTTLPHMPGGKAISEAAPPKGKEYKVAPAANVRPVPAYSRREQLARAVTAADNPAFARTAANRLWALMLGRGIVNPVDLDHPGNPPSHPELLDLLATEFAAHKFDVKWLLREIAQSKTYQRSSEGPAGDTDPPPERYLVAHLKPLTAEQLAYAASQATGQTDADRVALGKTATEAGIDARVAARIGPFRAVFAGQPGAPDTGAITTLDQSLFLKFGPSVRGMIAPRPGSLTDRLGKLTDPNAITDELFLSVLTRPATADERKDVTELLKAAPDRPTALNELVWALLASAEFRFNH
ncbi:MAG: hypothetical protein JWO38_160 [Gemmataceae bacterium]|nr:hypothetical protein [Gemmataceae bacterium]